MSGAGHNSGDQPTQEQVGIASDRLRSLVDRIERLEEERKALGSDIKDIYAEAKSAGFDVKVLRHLIRIRKQIIRINYFLPCLAGKFFRRITEHPAKPYVEFN